METSIEKKATFVFCGFVLTSASCKCGCSAFEMGYIINGIEEVMGVRCKKCNKMMKERIVDGKREYVDV